MDFELLPLLVGVAIGSLLGRGGKGVMKPVVKGFMTLSERAREMTANLREDMRDAVEEARYEHTQEMTAQPDGAALGSGEAQPAAAQSAKRSGESRSSSSPRRRSGGSGEGTTASRTRSTSGTRRSSGTGTRSSRSRSTKGAENAPTAGAGETGGREGAQAA